MHGRRSSKFGWQNSKVGRKQGERERGEDGDSDSSLFLRRFTQVIATDDPSVADSAHEVREALSP
jgi:hypothetical protein